MAAPAYVNKRAPLAVRGLDLYETSPAALRVLLALEQLPPTLYDPCCGRGAIMRPLAAAGFDVVGSDVRLYSRVAEILRLDYLAEPVPRPWRRRGVVMNPPYSRANEFVAEAITQHRYVAALLRLGFLEGGTGSTAAAALRRHVLDERPPHRVIVFSRRLPMMHRDGWTGPRAASGIGFAWYVWDYRDSLQPPPGPVVIRADHRAAASLLESTRGQSHPPRSGGG